jgi:tripartite-type tricarboxylate transporter receptor subunit TctC
MIGPMVPDTVQTFGQFAAWCRANPRSAQCGNPGAGSFPHFMAMLMARDANLGLAYVPYRGGMPAVQAVLAGQVAAALVTEGTALPFEHAGKLRILATTGSERSEFMPQVPTFRELGYTHLVQREWYGIFMPAKTPASAIATAADAIRIAMHEPEVRHVLGSVAMSAEGSTPAELQHILRSEYDFWGPLIRASGFTAES